MLFRDLVLSGGDTCVGLIKSLSHRYQDDAASTNAISKKLRQVCPSLYRNEDAQVNKQRRARRFQAQENLQNIPSSMAKTNLTPKNILIRRNIRIMAMNHQVTNTSSSLKDIWSPIFTNPKTLYIWTTMILQNIQMLRMLKSPLKFNPSQLFQNNLKVTTRIQILGILRAIVFSPHEPSLATNLPSIPKSSTPAYLLIENQLILMRCENWLPDGGRQLRRRIHQLKRKMRKMRK